MTRKRVDRILDIAIGWEVGVIVGILLMAALSGCVPGGSAAVCPPAQPPISLNVAPAGEPRASVEGGRDWGVAFDSLEFARGPGGLLFEEWGWRPGAAGDERSKATWATRPKAAVQSRAGAIPAGRYPPSVRRALDLLRMHESVNGTRMVGDSGRAQGWLQQHEANWREGCERLGVRWPWPADTRDLAKCEAVAVANWARYCPSALARGDVELLVRSHRLPCAPWRADNDAYWRKVRGQ